MQAAVGDRMVVASAALGGPVRDGEIMEVRGAGGGGPYLVRWSDTGTQTLFFPGPDAHVQPPEARQTAATAGEGPKHVKRWRVDVFLYEGTSETSAQAVLHTEGLHPDAATTLRGRGEAHRHPADRDVPEIGDEVAVARALRRLADRLLGTAADDIAEIEGHPVSLRA